MIIRGMLLMKHDKKTVKKAQFCSQKCPICTRAREKGNGFLYTMVKIERKVCPYCRSYEKVYDKPAYK